LDRLLNAATGNLGKPAPLLLAVAENTLKAFPGMSTVAGGLVHAVTYGLPITSREAGSLIRVIMMHDDRYYGHGMGHKSLIVGTENQQRWISHRRDRECPGLGCILWYTHYRAGCGALFRTE
jgi:hypothetical protein